MKNLLLALVDGNRLNLGDGALVSVLAILLVFSILAIIILITFIIGKVVEKKSKVNQDKDKSQMVSTTPQQNGVKLDLSDEDAVVATLIASIDYREKTKKDFKVISVKEIK